MFECNICMENCKEGFFPECCMRPIHYTCAYNAITKTEKKACFHCMDEDLFVLSYAKYDSTRHLQFERGQRYWLATGAESIVHVEMLGLTNKDGENYFHVQMLDSELAGIDADVKGINLFASQHEARLHNSTLRASSP